MTESLIHCEHSVRCGGCPAISLSYEDQLEKKHAAVQSAFALFTELAHVRIEPVQAARPITQYRTRAKWVTGKHGALGLFSLGTHEVQDLPQCKVIAPAIARGALALRSLISQLDRNPALVTVADGGALYAVDLRELVQRDASTKLLVTLVVLSSRCTIEQAREACSRLVNEGIAKSAAASWHDGRNVQMLGENPRIYAGDPEPTDVLVQGKLWQLVSPGSFVQTHRNTAAAIHDLIVRELSHTQRAQIPTRVLELYAGSGALGLKLAASGMHVRCVESFAPAVAQIDRAARLQGLKSISAIAQDAARYALECAQRGVSFDCVVVNPPRRGLDSRLFSALAQLRAPKLVYVSCDPETLARDAAELAALGYRTQSAQPFDMIPLSEEVETVLVFALEQGAGVHDTACELLHSTAEIAVYRHAVGFHAVCLARAAEHFASRSSTAPVYVASPFTDMHGLAVIARDTDALVRLRAQGLVVSLEFEAWVRGIARNKGKIERGCDGIATALTRYKRLGVEGGHSRLLVTTSSGNAVTVRSHLASIGLAVLGCERFGDERTNAYCREKLGLRRVAMQNTKLTLSHSSTGAVQEQSWQTPLNGALALLSSRLRRRTVGSAEKNPLW